MPGSEQFLRATLDALAAHVAVLDAATGRVVLVNEAWRRFAREGGHRDPAAGVGADYLAACDRAAAEGAGEDAATAAAAAAGIRAAAAGGPGFALEYPCHAPGARAPAAAGERWFLMRATRFEAEGVAWVVVAHEDVTARRRAEAALRERGEALEALNRLSATIAGELDRDRLVQLVVDAATGLVGAAFGAFFHNVADGRGGAYTLYSLSGAPEEAFARFPMPRATHVFGPTFRGEGVVRSDDITRDPRYGRNPPHRGMPEGHLPVRSYLAVPVVARSGAVVGGLFFGHPEPGVFTGLAERLAVGVAAQAAVAVENADLHRAARRELEERRRGEERRRLLLDELSHRVKNTLAVVRAIAGRTLTDDRAPAEAREAFAGRLRALAGTHELLTASGWRGASLRALAEAELAPYGGRLELAPGDDVALAPGAAQSLGLVLHELATNAAKHGALSAPGGRVELGWSVGDGREGARFRLLWRERGGPGARPPARRGFGLTLVERAAAHDLGGEARLAFAPEGLAYELDAPLAGVRSSVG